MAVLCTVAYPRYVFCDRFKNLSNGSCSSLSLGFHFSIVQHLDLLGHPFLLHWVILPTPLGSPPSFSMSSSPTYLGHPPLLLLVILPPPLGHPPLLLILLSFTGSSSLLL